MATALNIVVVEDHDDLREATVEFLSSKGHSVAGIFSAEEIDDLSTGQIPEVYVIDLNLPGESGIELSRRIRASHPRVGIVMTTARTALDDRLVGYESGADIYLPKPVAPEELLAALQSLARRLHQPVASKSEGFVLDTHRLNLRGPEGDVRLSQSEVVLLSALARASGQILERWQVAANLGLDGEDINTGSLETRISQLRRKMAECGARRDMLTAIRSVGYKLCEPLKIV